MKIIETINIRKRELLMGVIVAALSSVGFTYIVEYIVKGGRSNLYIGGILVAIVLIACVLTIIPLRKTDISTNAIFAVKDDGTLPNVFGYLCLSNIYGYLDSCITENEAFKKLWMVSFSEFRHELDEDSQTIVDRINKSIPDAYTFLLKLDSKPILPEATNLLKDAVECEFLDWLSRITCTLYDGKSEKDMLYIGRNEIASYLLQNKILDLLSRDITDRANFLSVEINKDDLKYIHSVTNKETGVSYEKFELLLPKGTKILRNECGELVIKNRLYKISFSCTFNTGREQIPLGYTELIFKENTKNINVFSIPVSINIKLNPWMLMFGRYENKFDFLNQLTSDFEAHFSFDEHLCQIGFNEARTVMYMLRPHPKG